MQVTYLGTGAAEGIPAVFCTCEVCNHARQNGGPNVRSRSSLLVDDALLIDITPDLFSQALALKRDLDGLEAILLTHAHREHCTPWEMRNLRPPYARRKRQEKFKVIGSPITLDFMTDSWGEWERGKLSPYLELVTVEEFQTVTVSGYEITALPARHCEGAFCYMIEKYEKVFLCANDTGYFQEPTWDYLAGRKLDFVCLDCNDLFDVETPNHMNLEDNITVQRRMYQLGCVNASTRFHTTHIGHVGQMNHQELDERMRMHGIHTAYDGLTVKV